MRLVGVPYAEVGPDKPVVAFDARLLADEHRTAATTAVRALLDSPMGFGWELVCDEAPGPFTPQEPLVVAPKARKKSKTKAEKPLSETFMRRPLATSVAALATPGEKGADLAAQTLDLPDVARAYSREDLVGEALDRLGSAPHPALYELRQAPDAAVLTEPARLLKRPFVRAALNTWNANASGRWAAGPDWMVLELELISEQSDEALDTSVSAIVALFAVEAGWAGAVWPAHRHEEFSRVIGFDPWARAVWRDCKLWFGE